jgi:hypothetical protein
VRDARGDRFCGPLEDAGCERITTTTLGVQPLELLDVRPWRTVEGVVVDLLGEIGKSEVPIPDTGSRREDLRALASDIVGLYRQPRTRMLVERIVGPPSVRRRRPLPAPR